MLFGSPVSSFVSFRFTVSTTPALRLPTTFLSEDVGQQCLGSGQSSSATGMLSRFSRLGCSPKDGNMLLTVTETVVAFKSSLKYP